MTIRWQRQNGNLVLQGNFGQIIKGDFHATLPGYGLQVRADRTWFERGNVDDGGVALATGQAYLFGSRRMLVTYAQSGDMSLFGGCDRLSINADLSGVTGIKAGHWGFLEFKSGGKANIAGAVRGDIKLVSGSYAMGVVSAFLAACEDLSGTHTGKVVVLHAPNPQYGTFDGLMEIGSASGIVSAHNVGSASTKQLLFTIDGSPYALQVYAVGT